MRYLLPLTALLLTLPLFAADPPKGFTPLFNGKNLDGWHGWAIHSKGAAPKDVAELDPSGRAKRFDEWTADAKKHWSVENGELVIEDLNSLNGTFVNRNRIYAGQRQGLKPNDVIQIGKVQMRVVFG